jgi:hypothetical protein
MMAVRTANPNRPGLVRRGEILRFRGGGRRGGSRVRFQQTLGLLQLLDAGEILLKFRPLGKVLFDLLSLAVLPTEFLVDLDEYHQGPLAYPMIGRGNELGQIRLAGGPPGVLQPPDQAVEEVVVFVIPLGHGRRPHRLVSRPGRFSRSAAK